MELPSWVGAVLHGAVCRFRGGGSVHSQVFRRATNCVTNAAADHEFGLQLVSEL